MWQVGAARRQLEMDFSGLELLGWGQPTGRIKRVEMPLQMRAVALKHGEVRWVYLCAELCFITQSVRDGVRERLALAGCALDEAELVLTATHTHSGPAGYAHSLFYNLTNPGHCPDVFDAVVDTMVAAIRAALADLAPGRVWLKRGQIPVDEPVAFNRAMLSFQRNIDAPDVDRDRPETATNRDLTVLRIDTEDGPRAAICWFAVHNTSVHYDNTAIHGDNKGVAAALLEAHGREVLGTEDFVGIYAQGAPGDVTPNFRPSTRGFTIGTHDDDFDSARAHGEIQFRYTRPLLDAADAVELHGLSHVCRYVEFDGLSVDADLTNGVSGQHTGAARYGLGLMEGTAEGPGPLWRVQFLRRTLVWAVGWIKAGRRRMPLVRRLYLGRPDVYGPMFPFLDAGQGASGKAFGFLSMRAVGIPPQIDPVVAEVRRLDGLGVDLDSPWTPSVMPVHLTRIGDFALVSVACEPTTTAGRRLADTLRDALGVSTVQVGGYSNAYHGYLTTSEEYQVQAYEGAHTIFGQWTLGAYRTVLREMAREFDTHGAATSDPGPAPARFEADEVARRAYTGPPAKRSWG